MSYHQPLTVPGAFPGVRAGLRPSTPPIGAPTAREIRVRIGSAAMPAPFAPTAEENEQTDRTAGAEDMCDRLREQMLHEIEQALETDDARIAGFHVGLATLYARQLVAGQANPG
jgi:hypothetical protein